MTNLQEENFKRKKIPLRQKKLSGSLFRTVCTDPPPFLNTQPCLSTPIYIPPPCCACFCLPPCIILKCLPEYAYMKNRNTPIMLHFNIVYIQLLYIYHACNYSNLSQAVAYKSLITQTLAQYTFQYIQSSSP